jgi:hypothetical protein
MSGHEGERDERGQSRDNAGAWAAAALVLALGGLGFGVVAQLRVGDLEHRVDSLEHALEGRSPTLTSSTSPTEAPDTTEPASVAPGTADGPDDPGAAEQAVRAAFSTVYNSHRSIADRVAMVDDPHGIASAISRAASGDLADQLANTGVVVDEVHFSSPTSATVRYSVLSAGSSLVPDADGEARLVEGTWKVARSTVCRDLESAGAPCPP